MLSAALFLDRDGVVNENKGYVHRIEDFVWRPGIFDLARAAHRREHALIVITNQSGIARGYYGDAEYQTLTDWMVARFADEDAPLTGVYHCPFHPEATIERYRADHDWRKPKPGMILAAAKDHGIDLMRSTLIGDQISDMVAAKAANVGAACLVGNEAGLSDSPYPYAAADVLEAARWYENFQMETST